MIMLFTGLPVCRRSKSARVRPSSRQRRRRWPIQWQTMAPRRTAFGGGPSSQFRARVIPLALRKYPVWLTLALLRMSHKKNTSNWMPPRAIQAAQGRFRLLLRWTPRPRVPCCRAVRHCASDSGVGMVSQCHARAVVCAARPNAVCPCAAFRAGAQALGRRRDPRARTSRFPQVRICSAAYGVLAARRGVAEGEDDNRYSRLRCSL